MMEKRTDWAKEALVWLKNAQALGRCRGVFPVDDEPNAYFVLMMQDEWTRVRGQLAQAGINELGVAVDGMNGLTGSFVRSPSRDAVFSLLAPECDQ